MYNPSVWPTKEEILEVILPSYLEKHQGKIVKNEKNVLEVTLHKRHGGGKFKTLDKTQ